MLWNRKPPGIQRQPAPEKALDAALGAATVAEASDMAYAFERAEAQVRPMRLSQMSAGALSKL